MITPEKNEVRTDHKKRLSTQSEWRSDWSPSPAWRTSTCWMRRQFPGDQPSSAKSLRTTRWTSTTRPRNVPEGGVELFDVVHDPGETRNLAGAQPQKLADLLARLEEWWLGGPR
jgi:hypothetical protein